MSIAAYLINLDRDPDRLAHMEREAARVGLSLIRVPAVLGLAMPDWVRPYFLDSRGEIASSLKRGEVGCYASHLVVAKRLLDDGHAHALVLEDDLVLPDDLVPLLQAAMAAMPAHWDILRLSNPPKAPWVTCAELPGGRELALYSRVPNNTGAQLLSRRGAEKLLAAGMRSLQVDEHLRRPWLLGLETFGIVPAPVRSNIFDSTIDAMENRGLAREGAWQKFRRRHHGSPGEWLAACRWQIARLGFINALDALLRGAFWSLTKALGRDAGRAYPGWFRLGKR